MRRRFVCVCHPDYLVSLDLHPTKINHLGSPIMSLDKTSSKNPEKLVCYIYIGRLITKFWTTTSIH